MKFSKVSSLLDLLRKMTMELTFEMFFKSPIAPFATTSLPRASTTQRPSRSVRAMFMCTGMHVRRVCVHGCPYFGYAQRVWCGAVWCSVVQEREVFVHGCTRCGFANRRAWCVVCILTLGCLESHVLTATHCNCTANKLTTVLDCKHARPVGVSSVSAD